MSDQETNIIAVKSLLDVVYGGIPDPLNPVGNFLRDNRAWEAITVSLPPEFEFDVNGNIEPTVFSGTLLSTYDLSPTDTIVADDFFEADANGDLQPRV